MNEHDENFLHVIQLPYQALPPQIDLFNQPTFNPPEWPYNNNLMIDFSRMVYPQLDLLMDYRLFMANVIEVAPRYRRVSMIVSTEAVYAPEEIIVIQTDIIHHWEDREIRVRLATEQELMTDYLGEEEIPTNFHPAMKIITWNCQRAGKLAFPVHCLGLKHSYHPNIMVVMETQVAPQRA